jgi:hypothetical protein
MKVGDLIKDLDSGEIYLIYGSDSGIYPFYMIQCIKTMKKINGFTLAALINLFEPINKNGHFLSSTIINNEL